MSHRAQVPATPSSSSIVIPSGGLGPSIFDLSSLPSDSPKDRGTGHGGDDLSLSDLSMNDPQAGQPPAGGPAAGWDDEEEYEPDPPFRLFNESPAPQRVVPDLTEQDLGGFDEDDGNATVLRSEAGDEGDEYEYGEEEGLEGEQTLRTPQRSMRSVVESPPPSVHSRSRTAAERREEQLHAALFQLRKMNAVFGDYVGALDAVQGNTERLERQVERTNAILDRYVKMLGQQEQIAKLVLDEEWKGGEADEQEIQERIAQKANEERERKEREERERREREEREREEAERAQAEQEARERAAKAPATRGRGVRGSTVRGSVRGRGTGTTGAGAGAGRGAVTGPPSGAGTARTSRPSSVATTRGGIPRARGRGGTS